MKSIIVSKNKPIITVAQTVNRKKTIASLWLVGRKVQKYQWIRSDNITVSPELATIHLAELYQKRIPLLTDDEWTGADMVKEFRK